MKKVLSTSALGTLLLLASCGGGKGGIPEEARALKPGVGLYELWLPEKGGPIRLGDSVKGRLWLRALSGGERSAPSKISIEPKAEGLRFRFTGPTRKFPAEAANPPLLSRPFEVWFLRSGEVSLPALEIPASEGEKAPKAKVAARTIQVESVLPEGAKDQPQLPDSLIRDPASEFPWGWAGLGAGLLALAALWYALRRRKGRREAPRPIPIPPGRRALIQLKELAQSLEEGSISGETLVDQVTLVLRRYLDEALGLRTREQTSEEILKELSGHAELGAEERARLAQIVRQADLVKFAKQGADLSLSRQLLEGARSFVLSIEERRREKETPPGGGRKEVAYA